MDVAHAPFPDPARDDLDSKTSALYMSGYLDAAQQFWVKLHDGRWLAGITVRVTDAGGTNLVEVDMLVTADAITEVPAIT